MIRHHHFTAKNNHHHRRAQTAAMLLVVATVACRPSTTWPPSLPRIDRRRDSIALRRAIPWGQPVPWAVVAMARAAASRSAIPATASA